MYAFALLTIIGMVTPMMGSLVRYKIPAIPFLLMFFLLFMEKEKGKKLIFLFNKRTA
jgi:drug/metabolite transporter (DMT)-like permease